MQGVNSILKYIYPSPRLNQAKFFEDFVGIAGFMNCKIAILFLAPAKVVHDMGMLREVRRFAAFFFNVKGGCFVLIGLDAGR